MVGYLSWSTPLGPLYKLNIYTILQSFKTTTYNVAHQLFYYDVAMRQRSFSHGYYFMFMERAPAPKTTDGLTPRRPKTSSTEEDLKRKVYNDYSWEEQYSDKALYMG